MSWSLAEFLALMVRWNERGAMLVDINVVIGGKNGGFEV